MQKLLLLALLFLPSCFRPTPPLPKNSAADAALIDLVASTKIIRNLINSNQLDTLLEAHDPAQLNLLLNNFSPAAMAFETEVLTTTVPLVCLYVYQASPLTADFIKELELLAREYEQRVKFVTIDADQLFSVAESLNITKLPTVAWVRARDVFAQQSGSITITELRTQIERYSENKPTTEIGCAQKRLARD